MKRRRRTCDDVSLPCGRTVLDALYRLNDGQKEAARCAWKIFKENPFDPRLRTHKIHKLSSLYGCTIYAVEIEGDLRSTFYIEGDCVVSVDIGTHDIYKG